MPPVASCDLTVVGSGPAGLMVADIVSQAGFRVTVIEKKQGPGKKLLIAGSSGLNITFDHPAATFHQFYTTSPSHFKKLFQSFSPQDWLKFINNLGIKTFCGTSRRYFVTGLKASPLLKVWIKKLKKQDVDFFYRTEVLDFEPGPNTKYILHLGDKKTLETNAICFCLGGASYEPLEQPLRWPTFFKNKGLGFVEFAAANVGYETNWPPEFLKEAEGRPLKNIVFTTQKGSLKGDLVVTHYGLEGTPIYTLGCEGMAFIDLKPDLSGENILKKLESAKEKLSPLRRAKKILNLGDNAHALLFHLGAQEAKKSLTTLATIIKKFPVSLLKKRPLDEAISSSGGLSFAELNETLMLKKHPGVFAAGEMLDWSAPTGGFLIQACASQGFLAGQGIVAYLKQERKI